VGARGEAAQARSIRARAMAPPRPSGLTGAVFLAAAAIPACGSAFGTSPHWATQADGGDHARGFAAGPAAIGSGAGRGVARGRRSDVTRRQLEVVGDLRGILLPWSR